MTERSDPGARNWSPVIGPAKHAWRGLGRANLAKMTHLTCFGNSLLHPLDISLDINFNINPDTFA
jgi:hypothetical protein